MVCASREQLRPINVLANPFFVCSFWYTLLVESNAAIRQAYLVRHGLEGTFRKSLESIWYPSGSRSGSTMIADLQALLAAGDDALASQGDETAVVTIGDDIRVERFDGATLVIVLQPSNTFSSCQDVIGSCSQVLEQLLVLMKGLQGSRGVT
ncbi:unnamed protein product [Chondrus crispus]|uniref:Uncharacterized protein n=1 Tax=Chondrus crispus TaxID=2769 RepID=R7QJJ1_CHOCR|nr:unnamed protein product [Chondrus crispus]CDF37913.1 unnamed protein product [Chondrus crispus]|eukprot:XP_005717784.1 unnamed protein product [Chondrus crispus]